MNNNAILPLAQGVTGFPAATASYTGTAGNTASWGYGPRAVLVWATTDAYIEVGDTAVATTGSTPLPAYTPVEIKVMPPGAAATNTGTWRVSALQISAAGSVYAKPCGE